jgi:long-chain acyl-CoA synthetase
MRSKYVAQCFVYGESLKTCLVAIIVPDPEVLPAAAKELGIENNEVKHLCGDERVKKLILEDVVALGKKAGLHTFEQVISIFKS